MKTVEQYDINTLYKVLKKHDVEILKYYNNDTVSDNDCFSYGINSDVISNCLNVLAFSYSFLKSLETTISFPSRLLPLIF